MSDSLNFMGITLPGDISSASSSDEMLEIFELLKPRSSSHRLVRLGGNADGAYLVPDDLSGIAACFSPGVNNFKNFEDELADAHGIASHMCDYSTEAQNFQTPLKEGKQTFRRKWLDVKTEGDNISLDDWMEECAPTGDLLLQMDIEGAEYRNLLSVPDATLARFRIIVIEVHDLDAIQNALVLRNVIAPFFKKLAASFSVAHAHPNNCCGDFTIPGTNISVPRLLELTYIRKDRLSDQRFRPLLPHPQDISRNVHGKPPLFLSEAWLENGRPLKSKIKMMRTQLLSRGATIAMNVRRPLGRAKRALLRHLPVARG